MCRTFAIRFSTALAVAIIGATLLMTTGSTATAATGDPVLAGKTTTADQMTVLNNLAGVGVQCTPGGQYGFVGCGTDAGVVGFGETVGVRAYGRYAVSAIGSVAGVYGAGPVGVQGYGSTDEAFGVYGTGSTGVYGYGGEDGMLGEGATGVRGSGSSTGVYGYGRSTGVWAVSGTQMTGVGLRVDGRSVFHTAGTVVVPSGKKSVTVTLVGVSATDFVLATVQGSGAFFVKGAVAASGQFSVWLNKAPVAPTTVTVAYFVISPS